MREQFDGIESWTDSIYFAFVTFSTLGYGDILPETDDARLFTITMVIVGVGAFLTALTMAAGPMIEARMKGVLRLMSKFQDLTDHVVICGYSSVTESIVDELRDRDRAFIIVEDRADLVNHLRGSGEDVLQADATRSDTLARANARRARALIAATDSDSINAMIALTAREYREGQKDCRLRIIVRVEDEGNIEKVRRAGADEVISPSTLGGRLMAKRAVGEEAPETD
jgi:voltage-gated potassium channel